jgi:hypothetical protein
MAVSNLYDYVSESAYDTYDRMSAFGIRYEAMNPVSSAIAYRARPRPRAGGRGVAPPPRGGAWRVRTGQLGTRRARCTPLGPCAAHLPRHEITPSERASVPRSEALARLPNKRRTAVNGVQRPGTVHQNLIPVVTGRDENDVLCTCRPGISICIFRHTHVTLHPGPRSPPP